jgi:putative phosphoribosyl transferase
VRFTNRVDAGRLLAHRLAHLHSDDVVVLGLPRGGVPVAAEVAKALRCPLDVILVRKLGLPWRRELAFGAIGEGGITVFNDDVVKSSGLNTHEIALVEAQEHAELDRRSREYRSMHHRLSIKGKTAVIVDDGVATGATARAACAVARRAGAARVVVAVPVAPMGWEESFVGVTDEQMSLFTPTDFGSVGYFYDSFSPISDEEVTALLMSSAEPITEEDVREVMGSTIVEARIVASPRPWAVALFIHGSGSNRSSVRNRTISRQLAAAGVSSVLIDVVADGDRSESIDMDALIQRLVDVTGWITEESHLNGMPLVLVGSSSGASIAVAAAISLRDSGRLVALVSRGGNFSAVMDVVNEVPIPVLMVVGSLDTMTLEQNRAVCAAIGSLCSLEIIEGASHLFVEGDSLDVAGRLIVRFIGRIVSQ